MLAQDVANLADRFRVFLDAVVGTDDAFIDDIRLALDAGAREGTTPSVDLSFPPGRATR